ncbi:MAG: hypothetical protein KDH96_12610 [Candidatus Riesia sp.]|nr:hypothetical protein [Candidatus Riesia sp.]
MEESSSIYGGHIHNSNYLNSTFGISVICEFDEKQVIDYPKLAEIYSRVIQKYLDEFVFKMIQKRIDKIYQKQRPLYRLLKIQKKITHPLSYEPLIDIRILPLGICENDNEEVIGCKFIFLILIRDQLKLMAEQKFIPEIKAICIKELPRDCLSILNNNNLLEHTRAFYIIHVQKDTFDYLSHFGDKIQYTHHQTSYGVVKYPYLKLIRKFEKLRKSTPSLTYRYPKLKWQ